MLNVGRRIGLGPTPVREPGPERLVQGFLERQPSLAAQGLEADGDVVVDRDRGTHRRIIASAL